MSPKKKSAATLFSEYAVVVIFLAITVAAIAEPSRNRLISRLDILVMVTVSLNTEHAC